MKRNIITTADGSKTIQIEEWNEQYHSMHGAFLEANHVFIKNGLYGVITLKRYQDCPKEIAILEIGFGTGLNALLTIHEAEKLTCKIDYVGIEAYPVSMDEINQLNYGKISYGNESLFVEIHECPWGKKHNISPHFTLTKRQVLFQNIREMDRFDLIYFDAFGPRVQPELWIESIFKNMHNALKDQGVLVTYSAKGSVRRAMQAIGFMVERLPGPPGKREMLRATK